MTINEAIFLSLHSLAFHSEVFDGVVLFLADPFGIMLIMVLGGLVLFYEKVNVRRALIILGIMLISAFLARAFAEIIKIATALPRPFIVFESLPTLLADEAPLKAFPSGHATFYAALSVAAFLWRRAVGAVLFFGVLLIGIARIIAGVHFPGDIVGGILLGVLVGGGVVFLLKKFVARRSTHT